MIFETKNGTDLEKINKFAELLNLRAISLDVKVAPNGVNVECKVNEIAKRLLLDIFGMPEEDFESLADIVSKTAHEIGTILEKYAKEVTNESTKKDKEQPVTA
jgi:hypothetical protein